MYFDARRECVMKKTAVVAIFVMLFGLSSLGAVNAAPSFNGSTGMINIPSADVLRAGQFSLGFYSTKYGQRASINANAAPNLEIGLAKRHCNKNTAYTGGDYINAKFSLIPEAILIPGVAIGVEDIGKTEKRSSYISVSKGLIWGLRFHAGFGNGNYGGFFAAMEKSITPVKICGVGGTNLIVEWDGRYMNYGIRKPIAPGLKIDAGMRKNYAYFGVSFIS
jgi:hypothetical protein